MAITYLDGQRLRNAVIAGAQRVIQMQEQLNNINVFPVADSDTGTNMALTMQCVAQGALNCKDGSVAVVSGALADSALLGARGNSGAILAQFFQGLSEGFRGQARADVAGFATAVQHAAGAAREAIAEPREGTILTVMQDWAEHISRTWQRMADFTALVRSSLSAATDSLKSTPAKLKVLERAGVVDAGAQGFVHLLEGVFSFVQSGRIERIAHSELDFGNGKAKVDEAPEQITFQYCTQAMVVGDGLELALIRQRLQPLGDSMIVAGSREKVRIHIHTNEPERVFAIAREYGELIDARHDDMREQHRRAHGDPNQATVAIITDSSCDLPAEDFIRYNIQMVPVALMFGRETYIDKVTITDREFYQKLASSPAPPTTSQPAPVDFREVYRHAAENHAQAFAIILSGALSGTLQAAKTAAQAYRKTAVEVVDSKMVSIGLGLIVREAAQLAQQGASASQLRERIAWAVANVKIFVSVETMEHLIRGGRVSRWRGLAANLLNLKPILTVDANGKAVTAGKTFGGEHGRARLQEIVKREAVGKRKLQFMVGHANAPERAEVHAAWLRRQFEVSDVPIVPVSPALGAHAGPGAIAIAFLGE